MSGSDDYLTLNPSASINKPILLTKTNSIVDTKLTEFPQYKSAISPVMKFKMAKQDASQLPNILTKDNNISSFYTVDNMFKRNAFYKSL